MRETLIDIREKIRKAVYKNEEHVRLSLVTRILWKLGWNVWDPSEVNSEYPPVPHEDSTRVDLALFSNIRKPDIFIEVKATGKISGQQSKIEQQLRNYNRDNTAAFSIITDGRIWRFYLSQFGGSFSKKCFKVFDILDKDLDEIELSFYAFLQKSEIINGNAQREAEEYLKLSEKQQVVEDVLPQARKAVSEPPYPNLPDALVELVAETGFTISTSEAQEYITEIKNKSVESLQQFQTSIPSKVETPTLPKVNMTSDRVRSFDPMQPPDLRFTSIIEASFGSYQVNKWNMLLRRGVIHALDMGSSIEDIRKLNIPVEEGMKNEHGYSPISGKGISLQNVDSRRAWHFSFLLAKKMNSKINVRFRWQLKDSAAYPGEEGIMHWQPN